MFWRPKMFLKPVPVQALPGVYSNGPIIHSWNFKLVQTKNTFGNKVGTSKLFSRNFMELSLNFMDKQGLSLRLEREEMNQVHDPWLFCNSALDFILRIAALTGYLEHKIRVWYHWPARYLCITASHLNIGPCIKFIFTARLYCRLATHTNDSAFPSIVVE